MPIAAGSKAAAILAAAVIAANTTVVSQSRTADAASTAPLQQNLARSWYRNYEYGVELDGKLLPEAGLYQIVGKATMLVFGPKMDSAYVWSLDPKVVRPVGKDQITERNEDEVLLAESSFSNASPIPWMQDGPTAVVFYAGPERLKIVRLPPIIGPTTLDEILDHSPQYRRGMEEYRPKPEAVALLRTLRQRVEIEVWFGSWCPHCRVVVPRFLKTMQASANANIAITYHGVPRDLAGYAPIAEKQVKGLPTFIFLKNGKEIGRIRGEPPQGTIEEEIVRILRLAESAPGG